MSRLILKKWLKDFEIPKFTNKEDGEIETSPPVDAGGIPESGSSSDNDNVKKGQEGTPTNHSP